MLIDSSLSAIVTGGASGLGLATVKALRANGAKVAIFDINQDQGEAIAADVGATFCKVDILSEDSALAGFDQARAAQGQERLLVHCAMVSKGGKTVSKDKDNGGFKRLSTEDYALSAQGILVASYRMASIAALGMASLDPLADEERGSIILTSSAAAEDGQVGQIAYGSLKAGVNGMVLPMARDLMDLGIRVNAIMPGIFATPPSWLDIEGSRPLGRCGGYSPQGCGSWAYSNDDIYFMEVCIYALTCENADELFQLERGEWFRCDFSTSGFRRLQHLLIYGDEDHRRE